MAVKIISGTQSGLEGILINVEVDICRGLPQFNIVGLPDASIKEAKERVRAAIINCGFEFPLGRITVNLAPADVKKIGSLLDLPIAIGILMESNQIQKKDMSEFIVFGELSLFGELKGVKGTIPIIIEGMKRGINKFIFPYENLAESYYFEDGKYYPFQELKQVVAYTTYEDMLPYEKQDEDKKDKLTDCLDFGSIIGQYSSKRALEIAAAGKHNILLYGEPGCGKTMLARALISILPKLTKEELLDIAKIYSACGLIRKNSIINRPFRCPNQTVTKAALIGGGGGKDIKPGEITLAHNGVLFLDEILEFKKEVLEALREPLEEKCINISRVSGNYQMPSDFLLVGAFNPVDRKDEGGISENQDYYYDDVKKYFRKFSSALLDRIDILNYVPRIPYEEISKSEDSYNSKIMKKKVLRARKWQKERFKGTSYKCNSDIKGKDVFEICRVNNACRRILEYYYNTSNVSLRGYSKVIKLARTIADVENKKDIEEGHLLEAISYRKNINGEII